MTAGRGAPFGARSGAAAVAVLAVAVALGLGGCGGNRSAATVPTADRKVAEVPADLLPQTVGGLTVTPEDIGALQKKAGPNSYLGSTRLWALRTGPKLRATLQVGRFVADSDPASLAFQRKIVTQIGSSSWRMRWLGGDVVYVTSANRQPVFIWFRGASLVVLSVAPDFPTPRTLLREALKVRP